MHIRESERLTEGAMRKFSTVIVALIGGAAVMLGPAVNSFGGVLWHLLPYGLVIAVSGIFRHQTSIFAGCFLMSIADTWVAVETMAGTTSDFLFVVSMLSGVKLFLLLPLGMLAGYTFVLISRAKRP